MIILQDDFYLVTPAETPGSGQALEAGRGLACFELSQLFCDGRERSHLTRNAVFDFRGEDKFSLNSGRKSPVL